MSRVLFIVAGMLSAGLVAVGPLASAQTPADEINGFISCTDKVSKDAKALVDAWGAEVGKTLTRNLWEIKCHLKERSPISIVGHVEPATRAAFGIVAGTGTAGDPFVIRGWQILSTTTVTVYPSSQGEGITSPPIPLGAVPTSLPIWPLGPEPNTEIRSRAGIRIAHSLQHFVVEDIRIDGFPVGLHVLNASHVKVQNSRMTNSNIGIAYDAVSWGLVQGNVVQGGRYGIYVGQVSSRVTIVSNAVNTAYVGIWVEGKAHAVRSNTGGATEWAVVWRGGSGTTSSNVFTVCNGECIRLESLTSGSVTSNKVTCRDSQGVGIAIFKSPTVTNSGNTATRCGWVVWYYS